MNIRSRFRTSACLPVCIYASSASFYKMMSVEQVGLSATVFWTCFPPKASMTRAHPYFTQDHHKASAFFRCRNLHKGSIGKKKKMQNAWPALGHFHVPGTVNCSAQSSRQLSTRWVYPRPCDHGFWWWAYKSQWLGHKMWLQFHKHGGVL